MLNDHKAYHYPPKIELNVVKVSSSSRQSSYIEIDVVGISGEKNFILIPKPRPVMPPFVPEYGNSGLVYGTMPPCGQIVPPGYQFPPYNPQYMPQGGYIIYVCALYITEVMAISFLRLCFTISGILVIVFIFQSIQPTTT